eukprot:TRINITY_DN7513_c0_g2_i1.p1 TRINITY_DN7513_c0_g2~~TRINITY_DN7513_c0_g2_i1.p1  ORF type:complete len:836 (-),score=177.21 TRINITY_DN7513_c0_g2_i1:11-2518(-)
MENHHHPSLGDMVNFLCSLPGLAGQYHRVSRCVHQFFSGHFTVDNTHQMIYLLNLVKQAGNVSQHKTMVQMMLNTMPFAASELTFDMTLSPNFNQQWYAYCQVLHQDLLGKTHQSKDLRVSPEDHRSDVLELVHSIPLSNLFRCHYDFKEYEYVNTKLNQLRDNSFFYEYALITETVLKSVLCFRERRFRSQVVHYSADRWRYSEDQWRIVLSLLGHQQHGIYMSRKWDKMEAALENLRIDLDWIRIHHADCEWSKIVFAKAKIMTGGAYLKHKKFLEADQEICEGMAMLDNVQSDSKLSILSSLTFYVARINAERERFDVPKYFNTTVDRIFLEAIRLAKRSRSVKLGIEMSLGRMQYLLACNTYAQFVKSPEVNSVELTYCGEQLTALASHELISGERKNNRTEQLFQLTYMNYCIRTGRIEEFQLLHDSVMYARLADVDNGMHLQNRRLIVTASWIRSPIPPDEKLTYTERILIKGTNETHVVLATASNGEFVVVKNFFIKKTRPNDHQKGREGSADDKETRDRRRVSREVAVLESLKGDPHIVQLIQCDAKSNDEEEICSLVLEHANGDEQDEKFLHHQPRNENGLSKDPLFVNNDLESFIRRHEEQDFSKEQFVEFALGLAKSLRSLHRLKIVHRDVDPKNYLVFRIDGEYILKLCDFAESRGENFEQEMKANPGVGNVPYRDPQVQNNASYNYENDVYSFGVVLARILHWKHWKETLEESLQAASGGQVGEKLVQRLPRTLFRRLALCCVNEHTYLRPTMEQIVQELEKFDEKMFDEDNPNEKKIFEFDHDSDTEDPDQEYLFDRTPKAPSKKSFKLPKWSYGNMFYVG